MRFLPSLILLGTCLQASASSVTTTADSGPGSLRAAVQNQFSHDTITFDGAAFSGDKVTISLSSPLNITKPVIIIGPQTAAGVNKVTITGPALNITATDVEVRTLDFTDCRGNKGGAIRLATSSVVRSDTKITGCRFTGNSATAGGAIHHDGADLLEIRDCVFTGNEAESHGGAIASPGGDIVIYSSTFTGNRTLPHYPPYYGGAISYTAGKFIGISNCLFTGNSSAASGGAIYAESSYTDVFNSTFSGNAATRGGAIDGSHGATDQKQTRLHNSTFSGNTTTGGGAALWITGADTGILTHCTITGNTSNSAGADGAGGAVRIENATTLSLSGNIIAGNTDARTTGTKTPDMISTGTPTIIGSHNLVGDAAGSGTAFTAEGNLAGTAANPIDPGLLPLADNGGPTPTHEPHPLSPAVDLIPAAFPYAGRDQRGILRPSASRKDAGAFERQVSGYDVWAAAALPAHPAEDRGHQDDPDGDGVPNAIEYLQGTDPAQPSGPAGTVTAEDGRIYYDFRISATASPAESLASIRLSDDLAVWNTVPLAGNPALIHLGADAGGHRFRLPLDGTASPRMFARWVTGQAAE